MKQRHEKRFNSPIKIKALRLLEAGLALGLVRSPRKHGFILRQLAHEWRQIDKQYLYRLVHEFREEKLVDYRENKDGTISVVISKKGKQKKMAYDIDKMIIKPKTKWDGIWRLVIYDIPDSQRAARDTLRHKLRELGFYEWQKSVFIFPFPCEDEVEFLVEFFEVRPFVRYAELTKPTNEAELKLHFNLN